MKKKDTRNNVCKNILFSLITLIATITVIELATHAYVHVKYARKASGYAMIKRDFSQYSQARFYPYASEQIHINSIGFRGPEFVKHKPQGTYRIIILGGSTAFGFNATSDDTTIGAYLERILQSRMPEKSFQVYSMAIPGYISSQELITLEFYGVDYAPDMVIDINGFNDLCDAMDSPDATPDYAAHSDALINAYKIFWESSFLKFSAASIMRWSAFVSHTNEVIRARIPRPVFHDPAAVKKIKDRDGRVAFYVKNMYSMGALAERYHFQLVSVLQPTLLFKQHLSDKEKKLLKSYQTAINEKQFYPEAILTYYPRMRAQVSEAMEATGQSFIDLSTVFENTTEDIFTDMVHLVDKGNELFAEALYGHIRSRIH